MNVKGDKVMYYVIEYDDGVVIQGYFPSYEVCHKFAHRIHDCCKFLISVYDCKEEYLESI